MFNLLGVHHKEENMAGRAKQDGFTLIEVVVVVAVIAILAAILTPFITKYIEDSRTARARNEAQVIAAAVTNAYKDLGRWPNRNTAATNYNGLYTGATAPTAALLNGQAGWAAPGAAWNQIDTHLWTNGHTYPGAGENRWNGPYSTQLGPDPWGNPYLINALEFQSALAPPPPAWVLSAGPNRLVETTVGPAGVTTPGGDDIAIRVR